MDKDDKWRFTGGEKAIVLLLAGLTIIAILCALWVVLFMNL